MSENNDHDRKPKFELGQIVATPGALEVIEASGQLPAEFLRRHERLERCQLQRDVEQHGSLKIAH